MEEQKNSIELFKHADDKIERIKNEVGVLLQKDLELTLKIDRLQDRIDNGVSVTGQKTLDKVTGIVTQIATFATALEKQENTFKVAIEKQGDTLRDHQRLLDRFTTGVFWLAFVGVLGGLIALVFFVLTKFRL